MRKFDPPDPPIAGLILAIFIASVGLLGVAVYEEREEPDTFLQLDWTLNDDSSIPNSLSVRTRLPLRKELRRRRKSSHGRKHDLRAGPGLAGGSARNPSSRNLLETEK